MEGPGVNQTITKLSDNYSETAIDDEVVVMSLATGAFFSLTGTGRAIWQALDQHHQRAAVLNALAQQYTMAPADLNADLDEFMAELAAAGLVRTD